MGDRIPFGVIKRKANKFLTDCNIDIELINVKNKDEVAININKIAECCEINIQPYSFSEDISGVFYKKGEKLYLGVNKNHPETRQRFTIAHEIGHHILHTDDILHYDNVEDIDKVYFRTDKIQSFQETEANFFAAEILMPSKLVERCVNNGIEYVDELAQYFNVSEEAMRYRLINLGYL